MHAQAITLRMEFVVYACVWVRVACVTTLFDVYGVHVGVLLVMLIPVDFTMCMHITISWTCSHSHLQYSIACRMQIWRGKVVMSGKQRVDTWGGGAQRRLLKPSLVLSLQGLEAVSIPFIGHDSRDGLTWNGNYHCRAPPPVCLPSVYLTHCKWPDLPGLLPLICVLQAIKYWRWEWPGNEATEHV